MSRFVLALVAVLGLAPFAAEAQTQIVFVYTTVDAVEVTTSWVSITGVLQGDQAPTTHGWYWSVTGDSAASATQAQNCERLALLAMSKPGQYLLQVTGPENTAGPKCKLSRVTP